MPRYPGPSCSSPLPGHHEVRIISSVPQDSAAFFDQITGGLEAAKCVNPAEQAAPAERVDPRRSGTDREIHDALDATAGALS